MTNNYLEETLGDQEFEEQSFSEIFEEFTRTSDPKPGSIVEGSVTKVSNDKILLDVGLKAEGMVDLNEFLLENSGKTEIKEGDKFEVYIEKLQNKDGMAVLSREKARRELAWSDLEKKFNDGERVEGSILARVKGGYTVNIEGAIAFLPGSQVDIRPARDITPLMNTSQPFQILKMDRQRGNIVVSRRAIMEDDRDKKRSQLFEELKEGMRLPGTVKNITHYGIFVDLGGIDGLVHITDMAWNRVGHPSELVDIGDVVEVQIIKFFSDTQRVSLGMKQLKKDPWLDLKERYPVGQQFSAKVTNIADYGAFVELEEGVEGLVHISEMTWSKRNIVASKFLEKDQVVKVQILDISMDKRRISLGMKQCTPNPWESFLKEHPIGSTVTGRVKTITEFGMFIGLTEEIDGMAHISYLGGGKAGGDKLLATYSKGDEVTMNVLEVNIAKERVSLGVKESHIEEKHSYKIGEVVTCLVREIAENGLMVSVGENNTEGYIPRGEIAIDPSEQRLSRFAVGEKIDAQITRFDRNNQRLTLSVRKHEREEERAAVKAYGSAYSGASLGDILGVQLDAIRQEQSEETKKDNKKRDSQTKKTSKETSKNTQTSDNKKEKKSSKPEDSSSQNETSLEVSPTSTEKTSTVKTSATDKKKESSSSKASSKLKEATAESESSLEESPTSTEKTSTVKTSATDKKKESSSTKAEAPDQEQTAPQDSIDSSNDS